MTPEQLEAAAKMVGHARVREPYIHSSFVIQFRFLLLHTQGEEDLTHTLLSRRAHVTTQAEAEQRKLVQLNAFESTSICANDLLSAPLYVVGLVTAAAGKLAPVALLLVNKRPAFDVPSAGAEKRGERYGGVMLGPPTGGGGVVPDPWHVRRGHQRPAPRWRCLQRAHEHLHQGRCMADRDQGGW